MTMYLPCFNSSWNSSRDLHYFNFSGRLFHKTLLKFNEFIPYFWVFVFGMKKEIAFLSEYGIFFPYMFSTWNLG